MGDKISAGALNSGSQGISPTRVVKERKKIEPKPAAEGEAVSSGVTLEMFQELEDMVYSIDYTNRINNIENQMRILKKMGASAPTGSSGGGSKGGPDLLDAFNEILDKNKAEFD